MIGILDSGIAGLTVAGAIQEICPGYDIIYFGDSARSPYGSKSPETVISYASQDIDFLVNRGAKLIVVVCDAMSSVAAEHVFDKFEIPILEMLTPAVELSVQVSKKLVIGIIGTRTAIESRAYESKIKKLKPDARVYAAACPLLIPLLEEGWLKKPETARIVKKCLHPLKTRQIDTLILGSAYYHLLKKLIQTKVGRRVHILDPVATVAGRLKEFLEKNTDIANLLSKNGGSQFLVTDVTTHLEALAQKILKRHVRLEKVKI